MGQEYECNVNVMDDDDEIENLIGERVTSLSLDEHPESLRDYRYECELVNANWCWLVVLVRMS